MAVGSTWTILKEDHKEVAESVSNGRKADAHAEPLVDFHMMVSGEEEAEAAEGEEGEVGARAGHRAPIPAVSKVVDHGQVAVVGKGVAGRSHTSLLVGQTPVLTASDSCSS